MAFETVLEYAHYTHLLTGTLIALFFLFVANILRKEKPELIKSYIFLKYNRFRTAFYIATAGSIAFAVWNIAELLSHETLKVLHSISEGAYNVCIAVFVILLYTIIKKQ